MENDLQPQVPSAERRNSGPRSVIHLPVAIRTADSPEPLPIRLRNISPRGIAIFLDESLTLTSATPIEVIVSVPYEISLTQAVEVRLDGKIIRVEPNATKKDRGVAAAMFLMAAPGQA